MPLIRYTCSCGHSAGKFFRVGVKAPALLSCPSCDKEMIRTLSGPSAESKVVIDNGVSARKTEINIEAVKDGQNKNRFKEKLRNKP